MDTLDIFNLIRITLSEFFDTYGIYANTIVMSRNYVNILKEWYLSHDIPVEDVNMTYRKIPIIIDECTTNRILAGRMTNC